MSSATITVGELLYDMTVHFTQTTEYGVSLEAVMSGQAVVPPAGIRIDVAFEGISRGPKIKGTVKGVDYLYFRADGQNQVHIHGGIPTPDGTKIAFFAEGVSVPEQGTSPAKIREAWKATLTTTSPAYAWVNQLTVWNQGTCTPQEREIVFKGYVA
jgi:hypothetical protein